MTGPQADTVRQIGLADSRLSLIGHAIAWIQGPLQPRHRHRRTSAHRRLERFVPEPVLPVAPLGVVKIELVFHLRLCGFHYAVLAVGMATDWSPASEAGWSRARVVSDRWRLSATSGPRCLAIAGAEGTAVVRGWRIRARRRRGRSAPTRSVCRPGGCVRLGGGENGRSVCSAAKVRSLL